MTNEMSSGKNSISLVDFYTQVARRVMLLLTTKMLSGPLYEVATVLENKSNKSTIISDMSAYENHQINNESAYDHQTLIQSRYIAGDPELNDRFEALRSNILSKKRDKTTLQKQIKGKRDQIRAKHVIDNNGDFNLIQGPGGMADIASIIQIGVLLNGEKHASLANYIETMSLLNALKNIGFLAKDEFRILQEAYVKFRILIHSIDLQEQSTLKLNEEHSLLKTEVEKIFTNVIG
jgi:glutamate-ammonia-ligase adenylyltransferase